MPCLKTLKTDTCVSKGDQRTDAFRTMEGSFSMYYEHLFVFYGKRDVKFSILIFGYDFKWCAGWRAPGHMADLSFTHFVTHFSSRPRHLYLHLQTVPSLRRDSSVLARLRERRHWNHNSSRCIFLFSKACRSSVGPTKSSVQWIRWAVGVNRRGVEADRSHPSSSWL